MQKLERATYGPPPDRHASAREMMKAGKVSYKKALRAYDRWLNDQREHEEVYMNDIYQVGVVRDTKSLWVHLSIKRIDKEIIHDWRDLQEIKNQILGRECEAIELYPAESRLVDSANQYHLWGSSNPEIRFPVGFNEGRVLHDGDTGKSGAKQRPFANERR